MTENLHTPLHELYSNPKNPEHHTSTAVEKAQAEADARGEKVDLKGVYTTPDAMPPYLREALDPQSETRKSLAELTDQELQAIYTAAEEYSFNSWYPGDVESLRTQIESKVGIVSSVLTEDESPNSNFTRGILTLVREGETDSLLAGLGNEDGFTEDQHLAIKKLLELEPAAHEKVMSQWIQLRQIQMINERESIIQEAHDYENDRRVKAVPEAVAGMEKLNADSNGLTERIRTLPGGWKALRAAIAGTADKPGFAQSWDEFKQSDTYKTLTDALKGSNIPEYVAEKIAESKAANRFTASESMAQISGAVDKKGLDAFRADMRAILLDANAVAALDQYDQYARDIEVYGEKPAAKKRGIAKKFGSAVTLRGWK